MIRIAGRYLAVATFSMLMGCHVKGHVGFRQDGGNPEPRSESAETDSAPDSMRIVLDTSGRGADISEPVSNFPVLIRLESPDFDLASAGEAGENLRFANPSGERLPHEIQHFDREAESAVIWVLVDRIEADNEDQYIAMFIADDDPKSEEEGDAVFEADHGFAGAWHLDEAGNSDALGYRDSSDNGNHGTGIGMSAAAVGEGIAGPGQVLDGTGFIEVDGFFGEPENISLSGWASVNALEGEFISIGDHVAIRFMEKWVEANYQNGRTWIRVQGAVDYLDTGWHHVACVVDVEHGIFSLFFDGEVAAFNTEDIVPIVYSPIFNRTLIGAHMSEEYLLVGAIDELRVHATARSESWMKLAYENQRPDGQTLVVFP